MNLIEFLKIFPDDSTAEQFFTERRWPSGVRCAYCDSENVRPHKHSTMPYYCRECKRAFSVRAAAVRSKLADLGLSEADVAEAVAWARQS